MLRGIVLLLGIWWACSQSIVAGQVPGAQSPPSYSKDSLYIYFTGGFKNDSLVIEYAGMHIPETNVTTQEDIGFARAIVLPVKDMETIHINLMRPHQKYATGFSAKGDNFIEVWYCKEDVLKFYRRNKPFTFD